MRDYPKLTGMKEGLVIGAGAAPWPFLDRNAEMMPNLFVKENGEVVQVLCQYHDFILFYVFQETRIARTHDEDNSFSTQKLPSEETRCVNIFSA